MASQQFYNPKRQKSNGNVYDDEPVAPLVEQGSPRASVASQNAQQTLNNIDDVLRDQEQQPGGFYKAGDESSGKKNLSPDELQKAENTAKPADSSAEDSSTSGSRFSAAIKGRANKFIKNKFAVGAAAIGGLSAGTIILLIVLALGLFKIPNFAENLAAYQFARSTRDMADTQDNLNAEKMAIDSADGTGEVGGTGLYDRLKAKYDVTTVGQYQAKVGEKWSALDKYRPNQTIANMQRDGTLQYVYEDKTIFRPNGRLTGIILNGKTIPLDQPSFTESLIPGARFRANVSFSQNLSEPLEQELASRDVGVIIRGAIGLKIRQELGVSLVAWKVGDYTDKNTEQSEVQVEQDSTSTIKGNDSVDNPDVDGEVNDAADDAAAAEKKDLADPTEAAKIVANTNDVPEDVETSLENSFKNSAVETIIDALSPVAKFATPICMIYDGSLVSSGPTINNESAEAERASFYVEAAGSQVKNGSQSSGNAAGAMGWKLGAIEQSNVEKRASGEPVDTTTTISTQSSPTGQFSIADAIFPSPLNEIIDKPATTCPAFTSIWFNGALALGQIAILIASFGTSSAPDAAVDATAQTTVKAVTDKIVEKFVAGKTFAKTLAKDTLVNGAVIAGSTLVAHAIVLSQIGEAQSTLATGPAFDNEADNGANQVDSQVERQGFYGRPLTQDEIAGSNLEDQEAAAAHTSSESMIARYLSPSNPQSLITHVASMATQHFGNGNFTSLFNIGSSVLNPINAFSTAISSLGSSRVGAASTDTYNYGNIQWGYSPAEEAKLALSPQTNTPSDPTFTYTANQLVLDSSGAEDAINAKYGPCFDPDIQIGDLETKTTGDGGNDNYYIVRDDAGNVLADQGLCSPDNLGMDNQDPAPGFPNGYGDLVFRWRVEHRYDAAMEQLNEEQNPTTTDSTDTTATTTSQGSVTPSTTTAWTFPLNTTQSAIIDHNPQWCYQSQTNCHHDFPAADIFTDEGTQVVAAMGGSVITAQEVDNCTTAEDGSSHLQIKGTDGNYYFYTHMEGALDVKAGDTVTAGQALGKVGSATCAQGTTSHLHIQSYTSVIYGDSQSMNIQPELVAAFKVLPP